MASTRAEDPRTPVPSNGFLASLLHEGALGYFDVAQRRISSVGLDVQSKEFTAFYGPDSLGSKQAMKPGWICNATGGFELSFSREVDSEGSIGNVASVRVTLRAAVDGSLIAQTVIETEATFPPGTGRRENWERFERQ